MCLSLFVDSNLFSSTQQLQVFLSAISAFEMDNIFFQKKNSKAENICRQFQTCIYVYINIYIHIYTNIHVYVYTQGEVETTFDIIYRI